MAISAEQRVADLLALAANPDPSQEAEARTAAALAARLIRKQGLRCVDVAERERALLAAEDAREACRHDNQVLQGHVRQLQDYHRQPASTLADKGLWFIGGAVASATVIGVAYAFGWAAMDTSVASSAPADPRPWPPPSPSASPPSAPTGYTTTVVQLGESPWKIALRFNATRRPGWQQEIRAANPGAQFRTGDMVNVPQAWLPLPTGS